MFFRSHLGRVAQDHSGGDEDSPDDHESDPDNGAEIRHLDQADSARLNEKET